MTTIYIRQFALDALFNGDKPPIGGAVSAYLYRDELPGSVAFAPVAVAPAVQAEPDALHKALSDLLRYAERNECHHEETHRGGAIWTICDQCGRKWSDDRNPFTPYKEPEAIANARAALAAPAPALAAPADPTDKQVAMLDPWMRPAAARELLRKILRAAPAPQPEAPAAVQPVPAGYWLAPDEPTMAMQIAWANSGQYWRGAYAAMRAAHLATGDAS